MHGQNRDITDLPCCHQSFLNICDPFIQTIDAVRMVFYSILMTNCCTVQVCNITFDCFSKNNYLVGRDIAFNKPAYGSSTHNDNTGCFGPQYVNNGKADCANAGGPIAHTKHEANPWFKVDLRGIFNIKTVAVLNRTGKFLHKKLFLNRLRISKKPFKTCMLIKMNHILYC